MQLIAFDNVSMPWYKSLMKIGEKEINIINLDGVEWLSAADAAWYLSVSNAREDRPVPIDYLRDLARHGRIQSRKLSANLNVYRLDQLTGLLIREGPGRHPKL